MLVKSTPPLPLRALSAFALTSLSPVEARSSSSATRCFGVARDDGDDDEDGDEDGGKVEREGDDAEEGKSPAMLLLLKLNNKKSLRLKMMMEQIPCHFATQNIS